MKKVLLIAGLLISFSLSAQNQDFSRMFKKTLEEKIKLDPREPGSQWKTGKQKMAESAAKSVDAVVSGYSSPESEVHAAINPLDSNYIVVSPIGHNGMAGLSCPVYYTPNFGTDWHKSDFTNMPSLSGNMSIGGGDPVLAYDNNGRVYMSWIDLSIRGMDVSKTTWGLYWAYSDDNGQTWHFDSTQTVCKSFGNLNSLSFNGPLADKQWMAVDQNPSSPYYNSLYMSYVEININTQAYTITVARKTAAANQFDTVKAAITGSNFSLVQFASISVGNNGRVHVSFFGTTDMKNYGVYHSYSDDGAQTFSTPVKVSDIQMPQYSQGQTTASVEGISDDRLYPSVYNAASPVSNHVYITWTGNGTVQKQTDGLDIYFIRSTDGGATFDAPLVINNDTNQISHQFYSSINVSPDGRIDISWYDRRNDDSLNVSTDYYISSSYDNGQTFGPNTRISGMSTDFSTVGYMNNEFGVGEYNAILSTTNYIIPVWADGRKNDGDLDIYAAFIDKNSLSVERMFNMKRSFSISSIYPNPASEVVNLNISSKEYEPIEIVILDMSGRKVSEKKNMILHSGTNKITLKTGVLPAGVYLIAAESASGKELRKFVRK